MANPSDEHLQHIRMTLTQAQSQIVAGQRGLVEGLLKATESLALFLKKRNDVNRQIFLNDIKLALEQPKVDPSVANNPDLAPMIKTVLTYSKQALEVTHNALSDKHDKKVLNEVKAEVDNITRPRLR